VSDGTYQGRTVAIKCLNVNEGNSGKVFKVPWINVPNHCCLAFTQVFCREVIVWKHLSHPNVLPLLGVSISPDARRLRILTDWMDNGNVTQYTRSNLKANRLELVSPLAISSSFVFYSSRTVAFSGHVCRHLPS
jgi:serine/threonine protein kinase